MALMALMGAAVALTAIAAPISVPERTADMNAVLAAFPGTPLEEVRAPDTGELLYYRVAVER